MRKALTDLVKKLRKLHLHFLSLEDVIFGLLTDRGDEVKLPGHRVSFLPWGGRRDKIRETHGGIETSPPLC